MFVVCFACSVVGPAVTFRVRPNSKNLTSGDVAAKAGKVQPFNESFINTQISFKEIPLFILNAFVYAVAEKNFLESETGLKVLQSGVGEVCVAFF